MQSNPPPSLPEIYDEAGKSPRWLPLLGIGLLVLLVAALASRFLLHPAPPSAAPKVDEAVQVSAASAPLQV
jgi:hypothetical protein